MVDTKLVVNQIEELKTIISDLHSEGTIINEPCQVVVVIEKLPSLWKDFKNYLKHKRKELFTKDLAVRLHIEEDNNRKGDKVPHKFEVRANIIEVSRPQHQKQQVKKKNVNLDSRKNAINKRIQGSCWVCGKMGHRDVDY